MPRPFTPKIVTANDLLAGDVVYQTPGSDWSRHLTDAEILLDDAQAQTRLSYAEQQGAMVVGVYLADAKAGLNGPEPVHFREKFRAKGPSNYAHGKASEQNHV